MKGVIVMCLEKLISTKFGKEKWQKTLEKSGLKKESVFIASQDVDDDIVMKLINNVCQLLNITLSQAADAFGDYWVNVFARKIYKAYYKNIHSAKEFLLRMDDVHEETTRSMSNARPPRFEYEEKDENTLIMIYKSHRGLIAILTGLIKGVGKYFHEDLQVTQLSDDKVQIVFN